MVDDSLQEAAKIAGGGFGADDFYAVRNPIEGSVDEMLAAKEPLRAAEEKNLIISQKLSRSCLQHRLTETSKELGQVLLLFDRRTFHPKQ